MDIVVPIIKTSVYQGRTTPESGKIVGYGAIIENLKLPIPFPHILSLITEKSKKYNNEDWKVFENTNSLITIWNPIKENVILEYDKHYESIKTHYNTV